MEKIINYKPDGITLAYDSKFKAIRSKTGEIRKNLIRIKALADDWLKKFGKRSINFINSYSF